MPDYQNAKIYKLWSPEGPEVYIGSTTVLLCKRKAEHKTKKNCSSKILFEKYEEVIIELIEYFPCNNKEELNKKEGEYIRMTDCINKRIAGRTEKEYREENSDKKKEYDKKYKEQNRDKILEQKKEYYEENPEYFKEKNKKYREQNKDKINQYAKEYREQNRDLIKEKAREKRKEKKNE